MAEPSYDEQSLWRDRNKIMVAGLPLDADDAALAAKFESYGSMFQAKVVYDNKTQRSRGFGFVTFQTYESALDAVRAMDQSKWDKRVLNVRFLTPKGGKNAAAAAAVPILRPVEPRPEGCTTVFVGNMPYEITEDVLRKVMSVCGDIKAIRFAEDIKTKEFRGFGYVQFFEGDACEKAVQTLHGSVVMGRPLKVDYGARDAPQVAEAKEALQKKLKKGICHKFQQGLCDRGDACKFAHVESHTPAVVDLNNAPLNNVPSDAPVCMAFQKGTCKRGDACNYRHIGAAAAVEVAVEEVEASESDDETPVCLAFQKGKCKRGDQCKYKHKAPKAPKAPVVVAAPTASISIPVLRAARQNVVVQEESVEEDDDETPMCQSFQKGKCKRGDNCKFRHVDPNAAPVRRAVRAVPAPTPVAVAVPRPAAAANVKADAEVTVVCQSFQTKGKCKRGDMCKYAHEGVAATTHEAQEADDDAPVCQSFQKGTCKRGDKCKFRHVAAQDVCQRFLQGKCAKGATCKFAHDTTKRSRDADDDDADGSSNAKKAKADWAADY
ncbi:Aste57867_14873 [Aphanomyces stellatus]|uniref:Aste57867_14873 protein n=1 Tax=Aphanomyces stellatus TaxID=120398 RepID=A0A485L2C8_9STRA|nr:hypothetical protein As57867_014817 [Aphanomyces stellatus]VFT91690.1 Aste57867_14873 [Aphanomyces stellatus]